MGTLCRGAADETNGDQAASAAMPSAASALCHLAACASDRAHNSVLRADGGGGGNGLARAAPLPDGRHILLSREDR